MRIKEFQEFEQLENMNDFTRMNAWTNVLNSSAVLYYGVVNLLPSIDEKDFIKYLNYSLLYLSKSLELNHIGWIRKKIQFNKQMERDSYKFSSILISWLGFGNLIFRKLLLTYGNSWPDAIDSQGLFPTHDLEGYSTYLNETSDKVDTIHTILSELYKQGDINKNLGVPEKNPALAVSYLMKRNYKLALARIDVYLKIDDNKKQEDLFESISSDEISLAVDNTMISIDTLMGRLSEGINVFETGLSTTFEFLYKEIMGMLYIQSVRLHDSSA